MLISLVNYLTAYPVHALHRVGADLSILYFRQLLLELVVVHAQVNYVFNFTYQFSLVVRGHIFVERMDALKYVLGHVGISGCMRFTASLLDQIG